MTCLPPSSPFLISCLMLSAFRLFFFFNDTATTEIYTLSLHDALPISTTSWRDGATSVEKVTWTLVPGGSRTDRKSTRLNSSHLVISYAVFCLKKKKNQSMWNLIFQSYVTQYVNHSQAPDDSTLRRALH